MTTSTKLINQYLTLPHQPALALHGRLSHEVLHERRRRICSAGTGWTFLRGIGAFLLVEHLNADVRTLRQLRRLGAFLLLDAYAHPGRSPSRSSSRSRLPRSFNIILLTVLNVSWSPSLCWSRCCSGFGGGNICGSGCRRRDIARIHHLDGHGRRSGQHAAHEHAIGEEVRAHIA